jgi:hypothetical protein
MIDAWLLICVLGVIACAAVVDVGFVFQWAWRRWR